MIRIAKNLLQNKFIKQVGKRQLNITWRQSYSYFSPVDKPILSLALTSFHQMSGELMMYTFIDSAGTVSPQMSVLWGAFVFRLGVEAVCSIIRNDIKIRDYVSQRYDGNDRSMIKWTDRVFVLDSVRDLQFYGVTKDNINKTIWMYYRPGVLISSIANLYLCLNFMRGANYLISNPDTLYLANLSMYDPKFLTPVLIILINFIILKKSRHPILININHPANILHCCNMAFMGGLLFVPIPGIYHFAYIGLSLSHILIRTLGYWRQDIKNTMRKIIK